MHVVKVGKDFFERIVTLSVPDFPNACGVSSISKLLKTAGLFCRM